MECCNFKDPFPLRFKCESHYDRVCRDVKELTAKSGFDFEVFIDFMFNNHDYVVEGYPDMLTASGFKFDLALRSSPGSEIIHAINSSTKETGLIRKLHYNQAVEAWRAEAEKAMWREKLRSVGIDPQW